MTQNEDISHIYDQYVDDLYTYAIYLGFERETIMDAIHDVFYKFACGRNSIKSVTNIKFYLFQSLKNRLIDIYKSEKRYQEIEGIDDDLSSHFNINVTIEDALIKTEEKHLIKNKIENMLTSLTDRQREVIYLRYIHEYDYQQISEMMNISVHGCRKLVSKAMMSLRDKYAFTVMLFLFI